VTEKCLNKAAKALERDAVVSLPRVIHSIPAGAYVEAQVVHHAAKAGDLATSARAVEHEHGLPDGSLGNGVFRESRVAALLYCLIVLPKEVWDLSSTKHEVFERIGKRWSVKTEASVVLHEKSFWDAPTYQFIRHLRNAVSHANFSMENDQFIFWDRRSSGKPIDFKAVMPIEKMFEFLEVVGSLLANLRNPPSH
jgi:hypothetical protein